MADRPHDDIGAILDTGDDHRHMGIRRRNQAQSVQVLVAMVFNILDDHIIVVVFQFGGNSLRTKARIDLILRRQRIGQKMAPLLIGF